MSGFLERLFGKKQEPRAVETTPAGHMSPAPAKSSGHPPAKPLAPQTDHRSVADPVSSHPSVQPAVGGSVVDLHAAPPWDNRRASPSPASKKAEPDPIAMLRVIHEVLDAEEEPMVEIPCEALLRRLPLNLRGPAWKADAFPKTTFHLTMSSVMEQMAKGRLVYPLSEFIVDIPEGWLAPHVKPETEVELDLARVVQAMPPDCFKPKVKGSVVTHELNQIRDFFTPVDSVPGQAPVRPATTPVVSVPSGPSSSSMPPTPEGTSVAVPDKAPESPVRELEKPAAAGMIAACVSDVAEDKEAMVGIPCEALLLRLPSELRGPAWKEGIWPKAVLELPLSSLLVQLVRGRITYPLSEFLADVPEGWVAEDARPDTVVELDLARVVQAMPKERFVSQPQIGAVSEEMIRMRDMFVPQAGGMEGHQPTAGKSISLESVRPVSQGVAASIKPDMPYPNHERGGGMTKPPSSRVRSASLTSAVPGSAWDGRDVQPDAGPNVVDVNRASLEDLCRLPGVGMRLAEAILAHRQQKGPFENVFELAEVEGIGPKTFTMITGLSLETRQDRHEVLNAMLGLARDARPSLTELVQAVAARVGVAGVVFSSLDGISLAHAGTTVDRAGIYAAIVPQMFRRTRRYWRQLLESRVHAMALPLTRPPLLLVDANVLFLVVVMADNQEFDATSRQVLELSRELHWLFDYRAVVRPTA